MTTEFLCKCGGCGRFLLKRETVETKTLDDGTEWDVSEYQIAPYGVKFLTRGKTETVAVEGHEAVSMLELAFACSMRCIDVVQRTFERSTKNLPLRALPSHLPPNVIDFGDDDVIEMMFRSPWPLPDEPAGDQWIDPDERTQFRRVPRPNDSGTP